jgi:hypothetical protein
VGDLLQQAQVADNVRSYPAVVERLNKSFDRWASGGVFAAFAALIIIVAWTQFKKRDTP